jgi:hypothetical protein
VITRATETRGNAAGSRSAGLTLWAGVGGGVVPPAPWDAAVSGDSTSTHCAHSFWLNAWDRVINGWWYIHGVSSYQKSITLLY